MLWVWNDLLQIFKQGEDTSKLIKSASSYPLILKANNSRCVTDYRALENRPRMTWTIYTALQMRTQENSKPEFLESPFPVTLEFQGKIPFKQEVMRKKKKKKWEKGNKATRIVCLSELEILKLSIEAHEEGMVARGNGEGGTWGRSWLPKWTGGCCWSGFWQGFSLTRFLLRASPKC